MFKLSIMSPIKISFCNIRYTILRRNAQKFVLSQHDCWQVKASWPCFMNNLL